MSIAPPDYRELVDPFIDAMTDELEANFYKGAPDAFRTISVPQAVGEVFYHALKVAWVAKNRPDDHVAIRELTADVANCALIAWRTLGAPEVMPEKPTILVGADDFGAAVKAIIRVLEEHFEWDADELMSGVSG